MHRSTLAFTIASALLAGSTAVANAQVYGGSWNLPNGSYQQSCINEQMQGSTLSAYCTAPNGQRVYSSVNLNACSGDIANVNGYLRCQGGYGYGNNNPYGYNNNYGSGENDGDRDERGDRDEHGRDRGREHHPNGNAYGYYARRYPNQYGFSGNQYALPGGSYQQSCVNARMSGPVLSASCSAPNGRYVRSSLDIRRCQQHATDIANLNGYLRCY